MRTHLLGAALLLVAVAGCSGTGTGTGTGPANPSTSDVVVDATKAPATAALTTGQTLEVRLAGNATTGYAWTCSTPASATLAVSGEPSYETTPTAEKMVGVGGTYVFRFVAGAPGAAELKFAYGRPWEKDAAPAQTASVSVTVR